MEPKISYIPGIIKNAAMDENGNRQPVAEAKDILDKNIQANQENINRNTYRKAEVYNKIETDNILSRTPETDVIVLDVPAGSTALDVLNALPNTTDPVTGKNWRANKVFRIKNDANTHYDEYGWTGEVWALLASKDYGIDDYPENESDNSVKSSGIRNAILSFPNSISMLEEKILSCSYKDEYWGLGKGIIPCIGNGLYATLFFMYTTHTMARVTKSDGQVTEYTVDEFCNLSNVHCTIYNADHIVEGFIEFDDDWSFIQLFDINNVYQSESWYDATKVKIYLHDFNKNYVDATSVKNLLRNKDDDYVLYDGVFETGHIYTLPSIVGDHYYHTVINKADYPSFIIKYTEYFVGTPKVKFYDSSDNELYEEGIYLTDRLKNDILVTFPQNATYAIVNVRYTTDIYVPRKIEKPVYIHSVSELTSEDNNYKRLILESDIYVSSNITLAKGISIEFGEYHIKLTGGSGLLTSQGTLEHKEDVVTLIYDRNINKNPIYATTTMSARVGFMSGLFKVPDNNVYIQDFTYFGSSNQNFYCSFKTFSCFYECNFIIDRQDTNGGSFQYNNSNYTPNALDGISDKCTLTCVGNGAFAPLEETSFTNRWNIVLPITGNAVIKRAKFGKCTLGICNPSGLDKIHVVFDECEFDGSGIWEGPLYNIDPKNISIEVINCKFTNHYNSVGSHSTYITTFASSGNIIRNNIFKGIRVPILGSMANSIIEGNTFEDLNRQTVAGIKFTSNSVGDAYFVYLCNFDAAKNCEYFGITSYNNRISNNTFRDIKEEAISSESSPVKEEDAVDAYGLKHVRANVNTLVIDEIITRQVSEAYTTEITDTARVHFIFEDPYIPYYDKHFTLFSAVKSSFGKYSFITLIEEDTENEGYYIIRVNRPHFFDGISVGDMFGVIRASSDNDISYNNFYYPLSASVFLYFNCLGNKVTFNNIYTNRGQAVPLMVDFNGGYDSQHVLTKRYGYIPLRPCISNTIANNIVCGDLKYGSNNCMFRLYQNDNGTEFIPDGFPSGIDLTDVAAINNVFVGNIGTAVVDYAGRGTVIKDNIVEHIRISRPSKGAIISGNTNINSSSPRFYLMGDDIYIDKVNKKDITQWEGEHNIPTYAVGATWFDGGVLKKYNGTDWE